MAIVDVIKYYMRVKGKRIAKDQATVPLPRDKKVINKDTGRNKPKQVSDDITEPLEDDKTEQLEEKDDTELLEEAKNFAEALLEAEEGTEILPSLYDE